METMKVKEKKIPYISVIVPVYNTKEDFLRKCIESLLDQTLKDIEIILIDDGSTDSSGKICDEYKATDQRIKVIHQINMGVAVARNAGLAVAEGEWITFVDADDWCAPVMCEEIFGKAVELNTEILIFTNYAVKKNNEIVQNQFFRQDIALFDDTMKNEAELKTMVRCHPGFSFQPPENMMGGTWCKLIKHSFLEQSGIRFEPELVRSQDIIFYLNLFEKAKKISYYNHPLYYYRYSSDSVSKRYRSDAYEVFLIVLRRQDEFIKRYNKPQLFREVFVKGTMVTIGTCMRTDFMHEQNEESFGEKRRRLSRMISLEPIVSVLNSQDDSTLNKFQKIQKTLLKHRLIYLYLVLFKINAAVLKIVRKRRGSDI